MILRTQCPNCQSTYRLRTPPPPEGRKYRCTCGTVITIAYPEQVREVLRSKGFEVAPESGTETLPLEEGAECNGTSDDQLQSADEMETLVDVPAAGRGTGTDTADTAGMQAQSASEVQDKPPAADRTSAPTSRSSGPSPSKEEELLRMNIVGDGGAGLTRPPRLDPLPAGSPSRRSPLDSGSVSALLAEHEDSPGIPREDSPRDDLTSPSELTDLPPLAETSSLRTPPEDRSGEAPPLEGESRPAADSAGEPEPRSPDPVGSVPSIPEPMTSGTGGDSFLPPAGDLPDPPNEAPAPPEEADGNFWAGPTPKDEAGAAASDETEEGLPAETPAPAWSGQSAFDRKPASAKKAPGKQKRTRKKVRTGPGARVFLVFKRVALIIAVMTLVAALFFLSIIGYYSRDLPSVESLATYNPPTVSQVYSEDGQLLGEFFDEQRYVVPLDEIPKHVQDAFVAAEDAAFWEHKGLDYRGILRAMLRNVEEGRMAQGASTITQQVARTFLLTSDKKLARKIKEAILAHRVENNFSKEHILFLYLNQISFGGGGRGKQAFGVQAASTLYFGKNAQDLSLAEGSILAGLPQAPSRYSPTRGPDHFRKAKQRQLYVLEQMADKGYITREQASDAFDQELTFKKKRNKNLDIAPYYVEHVRRYLVETYGEEAVNNQGLQVTVPIDVSLQLVAAQAVKDGVRRSDKIMGYRGPIVHHEKEADRVRARRAIDRSRTLASRPFDPRFSLPEGPVDASLLPPLKEGEISRGVVTKVGKTWALVDIGSHRGLLPVKEFSWCHKEDNTKSFRYFVCKSLDDTLFPGDEIEVRVLNAKESWKKTLGVGWKGPTEFARLSMEQPPKPQAALVNMRVTDGAILTMVGGRDYRGSEFNRATQAKRQVGSTFKPFCYAAALDHPTAGFTPSTILLDAPIVEESRGTRGRLWRPNNAGNNFEGETTFRRGLMLSRNTITLKILQTMGVPYVAEYVERFGFESKIDANMSMCLGTSSISLVELAEAYTVFSTLGDLQSSYFISEVRDRHGSVLESRKAGDRTEDVMDAGTAYQMVRLMRDVVQAGTATKARALSSTLAGKTGTTDDFHDAWFVGYTPELVTISWVGLDEFVSMGKGQYGGDVALPIFIDYMGPALAKYPPSKYTQPENIVMMIVDSKTGLLVRKGQMGAWAAFKQGTGPSTYAPAPDEVDTASFLTGEF